MNHAAQRRGEPEVEPVRVLGRGLRAQRGVHLTMRTLREAAGKTQIDVATASQINQADVSRLESREDFDDYQVSTLRRCGLAIPKGTSDYPCSSSAYLCVRSYPH